MEMGTEHIIRLIDGRRAALRISKKKMVNGICTADVFSKIVNGHGRRLDKLEIDALMQRVGCNTKNCNYLLDIDEYEAFMQREHIRNEIETYHRDKQKQERLIKMIGEYKNKCRSGVERQATSYFEVQFMCISGCDEKIQYDKCLDAIKITMPDFCIENLETYLYSEIEILLVTRLLNIIADMGERDTALGGYEKLLWLMRQDIYSNNESMRFFAKIIYDASLIYMERRQYATASQLCRYAIEKLSEENKFRYLSEMYELKARADAWQMISQKGYDMNVFETLYKGCTEYKLYKALSYIVNEYSEEYYNDIKCPMYREYKVVFIGEIIKQRRKLLGMTQSKLAYYINNEIKSGTDEICSEKTLSRLENGKTVTSWKVTRRLLGRLKLPPERYFFDYVSEDYGLINELKDIEKCMAAEKYEGLLERCETVRRSNSWHNYPYNQQYIEKIEYKIKRKNNMLSEGEAGKMLLIALERTIQKSYLTDASCIYLFMNEELILENIIQNMRITEGRDACSTLLKKMISGYDKSCIDENVCAPCMINTKRKLENYIENTGEVERAYGLSSEVLRDAVKHNFLGLIGQCLYDDAWNRAEFNINGEKLRKMLDCVRAVAHISGNVMLGKFAEDLYRKHFR